VFQSYAIWPHMTVFDNVAYPLRIRRRPAAEIRERVMTTLGLVEMEKYAQRPAPALSGGQQQRVAIARALVFEPEVLLLDEPLSNLDARLRTQMGDEFRKLQKRLGITSLYVTHDQEEAMALSDRVVVMEGGKILQVGTPEEIYQRPGSRSVAAFFGSPNLLDAEVTASQPGDAGYFRLDVAGRDWRGQCRAAARLLPGTRVDVLVRPECIALSARDAAADTGSIRWNGRVKEMIFRGSRRSIAVETAAQVLRVEAPSQQPVAVGDNVTLSASASAAWAIES